ncbi:Superoxide dismutase [Desulfonema limicola]|uniref:Superoxide dismutase n=1 Tax=Desulfonema limicola TaxID=45656 RepID=A0A975GFD4_9BACT|nr:Fe-Mn family superoxide dismutase [Desulfonema limicola]QTA79123.1 Superoxide dismutase [Desulfonema limicola]
MERRDFLKYSAGLGALALLNFSAIGCIGKSKTGQSISLAKLPYAENALEPYISAKTVSFHYGKHHTGYVNNINNLIPGTAFAKMSLKDIIIKTKGQADYAGIFNNAAQVYNHTFYWDSMKPGGGGIPEGRIGEKIKASFGSYEKFAHAFTEAAGSQFGSGWAWLVKNQEGLEIIKTANADTPIAHGITPIIVIDVWEHAYYLDYQNKRGDYIKTWLEHLVNWDFAEKNLG